MLLAMFFIAMTLSVSAIAGSSNTLGSDLVMFSIDKDEGTYCGVLNQSECRVFEKLLSRREQVKGHTRQALLMSAYMPTRFWYWRHDAKSDQLTVRFLPVSENGEAPSIRADSSSESGTASMNCFIKKTPKALMSPGNMMPR